MKKHIRSLNTEKVESSCRLMNAETRHVNKSSEISSEVEMLLCFSKGGCKKGSDTLNVTITPKELSSNRPRAKG